MQMARLLLCFLCMMSLIGIVLTCFGAAAGTQDLDSLKEFLARSDIDSREYEFEVYDCNEFSDDLEMELLMYNYNVGQASILSNNTSDIGHRFLWVIIEDKILFIEPQIDGIYCADELYNVYGTQFQFDKLLLYNFNNETLCYYLENVNSVNELV